MKIIDEAGNEISNPDLTKGHLIESTETVHHDAVQAVQKISHYKTIREYPNGGKDVEEIIDVNPVAAKDAYDEQVKYQKYMLYTEAELAAIEEKKNQPTLEQRLAAMEDAMMDLMGVSSNG